MPCIGAGEGCSALLRPPETPALRRELVGSERAPRLARRFSDRGSPDRGKTVESPKGIGAPETESAPSPPIAVDLIRERSVAPRRVFAGQALWRRQAIILPLIGRWSGGSDGKAPACHSPPPRAP